MTAFKDYELNFAEDKQSIFVESQLPSFVRMEGQSFVDFLKKYYKFLDTKLVKISVTTDDPISLDRLGEGDIISTGHFLMCEEGIDAEVEITGITNTPAQEYTTQFAESSVDVQAIVYDPYHQKTIVFYDVVFSDIKSYYTIFAVNNGIITPMENGSGLFLGGKASEIDAVYDSSTHKIIVSYSDSTDGLSGYVVDCLIENNSFTVGTPVIFNSDYTQDLKVLTIDDQNKFCVFYTNKGSESLDKILITSNIFTSIGTNTITVKFPKRTYVDGVVICENPYEIIPSDVISITGAVGTQQSKLNGDWNISNVTTDDDYFYVTFNTSNIITSGTYNTNIGTAYILHKKYRKELVVGKLTNDVIELGEENVFSDGDWQYISPIYDPVSGKIIVSYYDNTRKLGISNYITIHNNDIQLGRESIFNSGYTFNITSTYIGNGKHVVLFVNEDGGNTSEIISGTYGNSIINYSEPFVWNNTIVDTIRTTIDVTSDKLFVIYRKQELDTNMYYNACSVIDVFDSQFSVGAESIFSSHSTKSIDVLYDPILKKNLIYLGDDEISSGLIYVYSSYDFTYEIVNPGQAFTSNVNIIISGGDGTGASAVGVVNGLGEIISIKTNHGYGYSLMPYVQELDGPAVHNVYLGNGANVDDTADLNNPLIELEGYNDINGKVIGVLDKDFDASGNSIRKDIIIEHFGGSLERAMLSGDYGELYNMKILNDLSKNASLPKVIGITEVETPLYAFNNMHNFNDIDFSFNSKLFLGNDLYSLMYNEIMKLWPKTLTSSIENEMKSIVGRNINQIYRSLGTKDAIKFAFAVIYGREVEIIEMSEKIFTLNGGTWYQYNSFNVDIASDTDILNSAGRIIYNTSKVVISSAVHDKVSTLTITTVDDHNFKSGYTITLLNDVAYGGKQKITSVIDSKTFTITIDYADVSFEQPSYTMTLSNYQALVEKVVQTSNTSAEVFVSNVSGSAFLEDEIISGTLYDGKEFANQLTSSLSRNEEYINNTNLLNGSVIQDVPSLFKKRTDAWETQSINEHWDSLSDVNKNLAGAAISDIDNTDRIQDGDKYQTFSYLINVKKKVPYLLDQYSQEEIINTIKDLVHPVGFKVTIQEV